MDARMSVALLFWSFFFKSYKANTVLVGLFGQWEWAVFVRAAVGFCIFVHSAS